VFEPFGGVARRVLDAQHVDAALGLVVVQRARQVATAAADAAHQLDRVLEAQLGARADAEVRGVRRVAHQHHRRAAVVVHPALADHARKADPLRRPAQVRGVGHQRVAVQVLREQLLQERDGHVLVHRLEAQRLPHRLGRLDDEGRGGVVEAVGVRLHPAMFGLFEGEGEGLEQLVRAQPDEAAQPGVDVGLVGGGVLAADAAVQAVAGDDQVGIGNSSSPLTSVSKTSCTPSCSQRFCRMFSSRLRPMPQKPWPPERTWWPRMLISMSSQ
jgi:hypothetical protein